MALSFEWLLIRIHQICRIVATPVFNPIYQIWKKSHEIRYNFCSTNSKLHHTKFAICFMFLCDLVNIRYCASKGIQKDFFESCIKQTERLIQRENPWSCKKFWHKQIFFLRWICDRLSCTSNSCHPNWIGFLSLDLRSEAEM